MADNGMMNVILRKVQEMDCNIGGVSYAVKDKFLLSKGEKLYFLCIVRDAFGTEKHYSYSIVEIGENIRVLNKNSEEYVNLVKDLPDYSKYKHTSTEPLKKCKYENILEGVVERIRIEKCFSAENRVNYLRYLENMSKIADTSLYTYFMDLI